MTDMTIEEVEGLPESSSDDTAHESPSADSEVEMIHPELLRAALLQLVTDARAALEHDDAGTKLTRAALSLGTMAAVATIEAVCCLTTQEDYNQKMASAKAGFNRCAELETHLRKYVLASRDARQVKRDTRAAEKKRQREARKRGRAKG